MPPRKYFEDVLGMLSQEQLSRICKSLDLPSTGAKEALIDRLVDAKETYIDILDELDKKELNPICKALGVNTSGDKEEIVDEIADIIDPDPYDFRLQELMDSISPQAIQALGKKLDLELGSDKDKNIDEILDMGLDLEDLLDNFKAQELASICKKLNIDTAPDDSKSDLMELLISYIDDNSAADMVYILENVPKASLKKAVASLKLKTSNYKQELIQNLTESENDLTKILSQFSLDELIYVSEELGIEYDEEGTKNDIIEMIVEDYSHDDVDDDDYDDDYVDDGDVEEDDE